MDIKKTQIIGFVRLFHTPGTHPYFMITNRERPSLTTVYTRHDAIDLIETRSHDPNLMVIGDMRYFWFNGFATHYAISPKPIDDIHGAEIVSTCMGGLGVYEDTKGFCTFLKLHKDADFVDLHLECAIYGLKLYEIEVGK